MENKKGAFWKRNKNYIFSVLKAFLNEGVGSCSVFKKKTKDPENEWQKKKAHDEKPQNQPDLI